MNLVFRAVRAPFAFLMPIAFDRRTIPDATKKVRYGSLSFLQTVVSFLFVIGLLTVYAPDWVSGAIREGGEAVAAVSSSQEVGKFATNLGDSSEIALNSEDSKGYREWVNKHILPIIAGMIITLLFINSQRFATFAPPRS